MYYVRAQHTGFVGSSLLYAQLAPVLFWPLELFHQSVGVLMQANQVYFCELQIYAMAGPCNHSDRRADQSMLQR